MRRTNCLKIKNTDPDGVLDEPAQGSDAGHMVGNPGEIYIPELIRAKFLRAGQLAGPGVGRSAGSLCMLDAPVEPGVFQLFPSQEKTVVHIRTAAFSLFGRVSLAASSAAASQTAGKQQTDEPHINHRVEGAGGDGAGPGGAAHQRMVGKPRQGAARCEKDGSLPFFPKAFHCSPFASCRFTGGRAHRSSKALRMCRFGGSIFVL